MIYQSCSIDQVIARIIRNTKVQDSSYIIDMQEWIPEAMEFLRTQWQLKPAFEDIKISFHKGKLPCGLIHLDAVEYKGQRLPYSSTGKNYMTGHKLGQPTGTSIDKTELFTSVIETKPNDTYFDQDNIMWSSDARPLVSNLETTDGCDVHPSHWYSIEMGYLNTSIIDGEVRLHYFSEPKDENGFPLIPDNANYKEALYYYVRAKMIGAGYEDKVYREEELMARFETYARRAINEITYPTVDQKEQALKTLTRLIPPENYWENFHRVDESEPLYPTGY